MECRFCLIKLFGVLLNLFFFKLIKDVTLINCEQNLIPPNTRVTLKIEEPEGSKKLKGYLTSPKQIREEAGIYWGYSVR